MFLTRVIGPLATLGLLAACNGEPVDTDTDTDTDTDSADTDTDLADPTCAWASEPAGWSLASRVPASFDYDEPDTPCKRAGPQPLWDDPSTTASLSGVVTHPELGPVAGARVNVCREICRTVVTDETGTFDFPAIEAWNHAIEVVPPPELCVGTPLTFLTFEPEEHRTIEVTLLDLLPAEPMPEASQEVSVGDLHLTLGADSLEPPLFRTLSSQVTTGWIPPEHRLPVQLHGEVIEAWYVHPYGTFADPPAPLRITGQDLPPGATYEVCAASYDDYGFLHAGTLTVSSDGTTLEGDAALPLLSSFILLEADS